MPKSAGASSAFATVTALFFGWGFITSLVDPLVAAVKSIFSLSNTEAQLSAFAFFIAYGAVSLPAAVLVGRLRQVRGVIAALGLITLGCFVILLASNAAAYAGVLAGLFVIASGVTILQVAANPLAAVLGNPAGSHFRLTFAQAFNSLGTVMGPLLGAHLLLRNLERAPGQTLDSNARGAALTSIDHAFLLIAGLTILLAVFIWAMRRRIEAVTPPGAPVSSIANSIRMAFDSRWTLLGGLAIFLYVGAEVSIGTQLALFLHAPDIWNLPLQSAGYFVSLYWLGAMIGRFLGSAMMISVPAHRLLAVAAAAAALLSLVVFAFGGQVAGYAALSIGLFNSVMFPIIFTLTLERADTAEEVTAGFLCTAIVGGAFLPLAAGAISDAAGYRVSFIVPAICYLLLCGFAAAAGRVTQNPRTDGQRRARSH